jgi:hypothetical protein
VCEVVVALLLESERETLKTHLHQLEIGYKKAVNDHLASLTKHQRIRHIKVRCEKKIELYQSAQRVFVPGLARSRAPINADSGN